MQKQNWRYQRGNWKIDR